MFLERLGSNFLWCCRDRYGIANFVFGILAYEDSLAMGVSTCQARDVSAGYVLHLQDPKLDTATLECQGYGNCLG